ncbi:hypothetical protein PFY12_14615 [Chryseobacterium camelliae]|uniref:Phage protein n=1 Tax=Chryseobacterium camelliae TaxID=1265445 RepID=A0ABY7QKQ7_9FLAO|nr:hypothetical protein [Chryseobacterium camelliae]WBV60258.1 hypothetical protein PFY12_14615 [Chryseobacterium camelliae]
MEYMQNQIDNLKAISDFINENGFTWTVEDIYKEYTEKYCKGDYISHTAKKVIEKFKDDLAKITGIK